MRTHIRFIIETSKLQMRKLQPPEVKYFPP